MITFRVYGTPAPQGSKRHVGNGVMIESSAKVKPWRQDVRRAALDAYDGEALQGPLTVVVTFLLRRPASHFRTGKNAHMLRDAAPDYPNRKPDIDKLVRSTLDGLGESGIWRDDAQVVELVAMKHYAGGRHVGAIISIASLEEAAA